MRAFLATIVFAILSLSAHAAIIRGRVADPLGAGVGGARIQLLSGKTVLASALTGPDGSYDLTTGQEGRFALLVSAVGFTSTLGEEFYSGRTDIVSRNVTLSVASARESVTVTATGLPTPIAQASSAISLIDSSQLSTHAGILDELRFMPGVAVVQSGQNGSVTSLFVRGGQSDSNKVLVDGMPAEDIGGRFDFGIVPTTGLNGIEVHRGPESVLFGADASASVVRMETPRGASLQPVLNYSGDAGNFHTWRNEAALSGTLRTFDYYGAFSRFDSSNALPMNRFHLSNVSANVGWNLTGTTQLRATFRSGVSATGVPGAWQFAGVATAQKQGDQDLVATGVIDHQIANRWHGLLRYGVDRKREQLTTFYPAGIPVAFSSSFGGSTFSYVDYYGKPVSFCGANGYCTSGQAVIAFDGVFPSRSDSVSNRDQLQLLTDYRLTNHHTVLFGATYENERGAYRYSFSPPESTNRLNFDYLLQLQGDIKNRLFYTVGGAFLKNHLYGTRAIPRLGLAWYPVRPGKGIAHGTKIRFNFAKGIQEPNLGAQFFSLHDFLVQQGTTPSGVAPIGAEETRTFEGGVEQNFVNGRIVFKVAYFHNEFGRQIEFVDGFIVGTIFGLSPTAVNLLENTNGGAYINSLAYRAEGIESELNWHIASHISAEAGYTHLDAKVQRSFSSDNAYGYVGNNPLFPNIEIGASSPLVGGRPFRRPPNTGYFAVNYASGKFAVTVKEAIVSRSDDSTFLSGEDINGGNTLLLPNRNLDYGYQKLDANILYEWKPKAAIFAQLNNLLGQQHIGPIGYPSLPFNFRVGLKIRLSHSQ